MGGMLSREPHDPGQELPLTAPDAAPTDNTDPELPERELIDICFKAGFDSLSLDNVIKITGLPLETDEKAVEMKIKSKEHTWEDKELTQDILAYFTITSKLLLWRTRDEGQNNVNVALKDLIQESGSLEQRLRAHYTKINGPKKTIYLVLQNVASIFTMIPVAGPLYTPIFVTEDDTSRSYLLSFVYLAIGAIGKGGVWFLKRKRNALAVQEELIGLLLMSMVFRNKDSNRINRFLREGGSTTQTPVFNVAICKLMKSLKSDRILILQKLSELMESTSPEFSSSSVRLYPGYSNSDRTGDD